MSEIQIPFLSLQFAGLWRPKKLQHNNEPFVGFKKIIYYSSIYVCKIQRYSSSGSDLPGSILRTTFFRGTKIFDTSSKDIVNKDSTECYFSGIEGTTN
jgi:hypothetical protein